MKESHKETFERIVSALALSIVAAVLFFAALALSSLVSTSPKSQVAATEAATAVPIPQPKPLTEEQLEDEIKKKCEELRKQYSGKSVGTRSTHDTVTYPVAELGAQYEEKRCVGIIVVQGGSGGYGYPDPKCVGLETKVSVDSKGVVTSKSTPTLSVPAGTCRVSVCEGQACSIAQDVKANKSMRDTLAGIIEDPNTLVSIPENQLKNMQGGFSGNTVLRDAFDLAKETAIPQQIQANEAIIKSTQSLLRACSQSQTCSESDLVHNYNKITALEQQNEKLGESLAYLKKQQVPLQPVPLPRPKPEIPQQLPQQLPQQPQTPFSGQQSQQPSTQPGLLERLMQALGAGQGQPPAGNQQPQAPGDCSPQLLCSGNTLYSRNNQCVDAPVQLCPYGCKSKTECAPQPQECRQTPAQPDPAGCANGTWKSTKTGNCVTGWQCVPSESSGTGSPPTAELSCQPQIADVGMTLAITWGCSSGVSIGSGFVTGGEISGATSTVLAPPPIGSNVANFGLTCTNKGLASSASCTVQVAKPAIVLVANPSSVGLGEQATIGWVTAGMNGCVVSSPEQPEFTAENASHKNINGAVKTRPITTTTTFFLSCTTVGGNVREASTTVVVSN